MELIRSDNIKLMKRLSLFLAIVSVIVLGIILASVDWKVNTKGEKKPDKNIGLPDKYGITPITQEPETEVIAVIHKQESDVLKIVDHSAKADEKITIPKEIQEDFKMPPIQYINPKEAKRLPDVDVKNERVYLSADEMPKFQGDDPNSFREWIRTHTRYPQIAAENGISGKVIVQFSVNSKGEVMDISVVRSVDAALDREAMRVIASSPRWTPGRQRGQPVKVQFNFPVSFVLQ
jgi:protein TonB